MWGTGASIRRRVPLLICGLLLGVIASYGLASYQVVRTSVVADSEAHLTEAVAQLEGMLEVQAREARERVRRLAGSDALVAYLRGASTAGRPGASPGLREALADADGRRTHLASQLLDASGRVVAVAPDTVPALPSMTVRELDRVLASPTRVATGSFRAVAGTPLYPIVARVGSEEATPGYLVRWQRLGTSPEARGRIEHLIGPDVRLYLGNAAGDLWTDLVTTVPSPTDTALEEGLVNYVRRGAGAFLGATATIPGTPWAVLVELPRDLAFAPVRATLRWLVLVGLVILALGTGLAWALSKRATGDLTKLAAAAESISRGRYGQRVEIDRSDEIGALGRAFNTMSAAVAEARASLERKIEQLAESEALHREAEERLHHVTASSPAILYELSPDGGTSELEWISDNVRERLGYTVEEAMQPGWWTSHLHPEDRELLGGDETSRVPDKDRTREYRFRHADGDYRWLRDDERVLRDGDGRVIEMVGALSDISDRRQLEEQFRISQKLEAVGRLAGGVAHDFNNLLTVILGEVDVAADAAGAADQDGGGGEGSPGLEEPLRNIKGAAERAADLTRQLLTFSRQSVVEASAFDANAVVRELHSMLRRVIGEDVDLELQLAEPIGAVVADRGQVEQVLMNLVVNAHDATPPGGTITIETAEVFLDDEAAGSHGQLTSGEFIILAVSDTGTGMTEEVQAHLFEPFFTTKETGKGSGLGLATSYAIVDRFGGHIMVYSEPGVGTTVKVYLPRAAEPAAEPSPGRSNGLPRGGETILVVEDDDAVRSITTRILAAQGYRVIEATDGEAAMAMVEADPDTIDLLLTDVVMPRMGGRALAARVRELRSDLPVLFASGYSDEFVVQNRLFDRDMALVQKPFTRDVLARKVREALDRTR